MPKNETKAYEYFLNATLEDKDADSWYNAGYCLQNGYGVPRDLETAAQFYQKAVTKYGHFGSAYLLGQMYYDGAGVPRSVSSALNYLNSINALGLWAGWSRRGLDAYLERNVDHASLCYLHASEIGGFEVTHSNAAFLLMRSVRVHRPPFHSVLWTGVVDAIQSSVFGKLGWIGVFNDTLSRNTSVCNITSCDNSSLTARTEANSTSLRRNITGLTEGLYHPSALLRQLLLAVRSGNAEVMRDIGDVFYNDQYVPFDKRPGGNRSLLWYSRASARGSALSSFNLGFMYQFGIGVAAKDLERAERYYAQALEHHEKDEVNSIPVILLGRLMSWWLKISRNRSWLKPANDILEGVVKKFDFF